MNSQTVRERIKDYLQHHPVANVAQVVDAITDVTASANEKDKRRFYNKVSFYLHQLTDEGLVQNVRYGHYSLTEKGLQQRHTKQTQAPTTVQPQTSSSLAVHDINLDDSDVILAFKTKYGRQRLLEILEKIKKIIE